VTIVGILLAGGLSRRMGGGDKCLRPLGSSTILARIVARVAPQVATLALNANGDPARFADYRLPIVADSIPDFAGPLAGVLAGLDWAAAYGAGASHVASFATDAPFLPRDLVARFAAAREREGADLVCAASGGRNHPVFGLWPVALRDELRRAMAEDGIRKVDAWTSRYRLAVVDYPAEPFDPFFNTNRPDDLAVAESLVAAEGV
jgi:molybdopterin-guanine dinucleotide biosynthesis protein A